MTIEQCIDIINQHKRPDIIPEYVPYNYLLHDGIDAVELRNALNAAFKKGLIKVHKGINHKLIEVL